MIHYTEYSAEELAMDDDFQKWVQRPDPASDQLWQNWLEQHPEKWELVQEARQLVELLSFRQVPPISSDEENIWDRIQASTRSHPTEVSVPHRPSFRYRLPLIWAAVVSGVAILGSVLFVLNTRHQSYATEYGQIREVTLPDGSRIIMNAHSTLELASDWEDGHTREVWLEGEAFFKVMKKSRPTPFIVHTRGLNVEVLGTEFNVASRTGNLTASEQRTQVVLHSGKVKLTLEQAQKPQSVLMEPGDLVELTAQQPNLRKKRVNPALYSSWANQEWMLENTSLQEVKDRLANTFGLEVEFATADIAQERMSGIVSTQNLDELLDALSTINGLKIRKENNHVFISR